MARVLKHTECPACGHRHHFCLPVGDLEAGRDYEFVCPETAKRASLRAASGGEEDRSPPQGAVQLAAAQPQPTA